MLSLEVVHGTQGVVRAGMRFDGVWSRLNGRAPSADPRAGPGSDDIDIYGVSLNGTVGLTGWHVEPYLLAGVGLYVFQSLNPARRERMVAPGVQAGIGLELRLWKWINPFFEARSLINFTAGYFIGPAVAIEPTVYWPWMIGLRLR
jgi:hypothetical protein